MTPIISAGKRTAPATFSGGTSIGPHHLALYEYSGAIEPLREHLLARVDSGDVVLPEWFDRISFMTLELRAQNEECASRRATEHMLFTV